MAEERIHDLPFSSIESAIAGMMHTASAASAGEIPLKGHPGKSIDVFAEGKQRFLDHVVKKTGDLPPAEQMEALREEYLKAMRLCESPIERNLLAALVTGAWASLGADFPRVHEAKNYAEAFPKGRVVLVPQMALLRFRVDVGVIATTERGDRLLIGMECDGKEFHQDAQKDADRDAYLGAIGVRMIRMSGRILNEAPLTISDILIAKIEGLLR